MKKLFLYIVGVALLIVCISQVLRIGKIGLKNYVSRDVFKSEKDLSSLSLQKSIYFSRGFFSYSLNAQIDNESQWLSLGDSLLLNIYFDENKRCYVYQLKTKNKNFLNHYFHFDASQTHSNSNAFKNVYTGIKMRNANPPVNLMFRGSFENMVDLYELGFYEQKKTFPIIRYDSNQELMTLEILTSK